MATAVSAPTVRYVSATVLCSILGIGKTFLYERLLPKGLPSHKLGGRRLFDPEACVRWVQDHGDSAPPAGR